MNNPRILLTSMPHQGDYCACRIPEDCLVRYSIVLSNPGKVAQHGAVIFNYYEIEGST